MKTLLKTLFLATAVSCAANAFADSTVGINFLDKNGKPVTQLTASGDVFVQLINIKPTASTVVFHSDGTMGSGLDIQISDLAASGLSYVHPSYNFDSCLNTSYSAKYQPGSDSTNLSYCLVRLYFTAPAAGTSVQPFQISAVNTATTVHDVPTTAVLNLS